MPMCNFAVHIMCKGLPEEQLQNLHISSTPHCTNEEYSYLPMDTLTKKLCFTVLCIGVSETGWSIHTC